MPSDSEAEPCSLAESAVRIYLFYAVGGILLLAVAAVVGTVVPGLLALVVAFLVLFAGVLAGLFWHGRIRS